MRSTILTLAALLMVAGAGLAGEAEIPVHVPKRAGLEVTDAQVAWVRVWLVEHLHASDLAGLEVRVVSLGHPLADYGARAVLAPRETGTYHVQREIVIRNRAWPSWRWRDAEEGKDWMVHDGVVVRRVFELGEARKLLPLDDTMSFLETQAVLKAVQEGALDLVADDVAPARIELGAVSSVSKQKDGRIRIRTITRADGLGGAWVGGRLEAGRFRVEEAGYWIA